MKSFAIRSLLVLSTIVLLPVTATAQSSLLSVYDLKCENLHNPLGIDNGKPHFSWKLQVAGNVHDEKQTAYEIEIGTDSAKLVAGKADVWKSGRVASSQQVMVAYSGEVIRPRSLCFWRVRSYDKSGNATQWSDVARFSVGVDETLLQGDYIMQPESLGNQEAPVLWKTVKLKKVGRTLMHVNSLGYHEVYVNGQRVSDTYLAPSQTQLTMRSAIVTYDITSALRKGNNDIAICLGQGWYKKATFDAKYAGPVVKAEIDVVSGKKTEVIAKTDATWMATPSGYSGIGSWGPLQFGGEKLDGAVNAFTQPLTAANLAKRSSAPVQVVEIADMKATPTMFAGNRIVNTMQPIYGRMTPQGWVADLGRNISGYFAMTFHNLRKGHDGGVPHVAPEGGGGGGPYWCGFIVRAPYRAYLNYADDRMLQKHYGNMTHWLEYVKQYSPNGLLGRWPDTKNRGWFLGDWLTPMGVDAGDENSVMHVSNCFVSECLASMTQIANHLGKTDDAERYASWRKELLKKIHDTYYHPEDSTYASGSPLDMSYAMNTGVVPQELFDGVKQKLEVLSRTKYNTHIAVGLVGVAIFTEWATRNKEANLMYDILKQPDYPGYMDMINHDATTTWESWDRSRSRIHNCYNGIGTWFYQALGGIIPDEEHPGYEHFTVTPQYPDALQWTRVNKETPYGTITVEWRRLAGKTQLNVTIPVGSTATISLPDGQKEVGSGFHHWLF